LSVLLVTTGKGTDKRDQEVSLVHGTQREAVVNDAITKEKNSPNAFERAMRYIRPVLLIIAIGLLVYLIHRAGPKELLDIVLGLSPAWIAAALFFGLINLMLAALRYKSLAARELKYHQVFEVILASYLLNYASMVQGVGIGAKVGLMKGRRVPASRSLGGAGGEVVFDLLFTGLVAAVFAGYVGWSKSGMDDLSPVVLVAAAVVAVLFVAGMMLFAKVSGFGARMVDVLKGAFSLSRLPINIALTAGIWIAAAAGYYCMIRSAGAAVPLLLPLAALSVGFVAGLISLVPGGLGVRDLTWAYVCSTAGISITITGTAALINRLLIILLAAVMLGLWTLLGRRGA